MDLGNKLRPQTQIWDDFENDTKNTAIGGGWTAYLSSAAPQYTATEKHSGQYSIMNSIFKGSRTSFNTAWQPFSLIFKVNIDTFSANEVLYLFVIKRDGIASKAKRIN